MCPLNDYCSCHEDDEAERQSDTACCPRVVRISRSVAAWETIPDSCSCLEGCECVCTDCICDNWGEDGESWSSGPSLVELDAYGDFAPERRGQ